ncbi:MAG: S9 family peptidase [Actinobacteria bacterium]|nr:S9 family peptidase [Actinomycetota bacterium]
MPNHRTSPPLAELRPQGSILHGVERIDEYAWLRDLEDPAVAAYLAAERAYYNSCTAHLEPLRERLFLEMCARVPTIERSAEWNADEHVYWTERSHNAEHEQLKRRRLRPSAAAVPNLSSRSTTAPRASAVASDETLLDLEALAATSESAHLDLGAQEISPDGHLLAYSVDLDGSEMFELRIRDLERGVDLPDVRPQTAPGVAWSADSGTLFYVVRDRAQRPHQVWRHRVGTPVERDVLVFQEHDRRFEVTVRTTRSRGLIVVDSASRDASEVLVLPADAPDSPLRSIASRRKGHEYKVEHAPGPLGNGLVILTNSGDAREFRLAWAPLESPGEKGWNDLLDHDPRERLFSIDAFSAGIVVGLRRDSTQLFRAFPHGGAPFEILPDHTLGNVRLGRNEEWRSPFLTVVQEAELHPPTTWDVDLLGGSRRERHRTTVPAHDPDHYLAEQLWVETEDRERIPISIVRHRDTPLDGSAPCLLSGYGAYEDASEPEFDITLPCFLDRGLILAHAHVRGGGEMGRRWWLDGRLARKKNSFSDFLAVADFLAAGLVDGQRIVSRGASAGGLLVAAAMSQCPARFRGVVAEVPFVDVVNTMLDDSLPLTVNEWDEWGDPHHPEQAAYMLAYSPYDNIPPPGRPLTLITGAVNDPRVLVHEPAKWTARLRASAADHGAVTDLAGGAGDSDPAEPPARPSGVLFRVELEEGAHGGPSGRYSALREEAEIQAVVLALMGVG